MIKPHAVTQHGVQVKIAYLPISRKMPEMRAMIPKTMLGIATAKMDTTPTKIR